MMETMKLYFSVDGWIDYNNGYETAASTERIFDDDIVHSVPKDEILKVTNGGVIAHVKRK